MKRTVCVALIVLLAWCGAAFAQGGMMPGPGTAHSTTSYSGPGDVFSTSPYAFYSCSRAYTSAYASGAGNLCRVTRTSDSAQCTIKAKSTGFADLTTANCSGNTQTIVQFCNATTCNIDTAYDQTANVAGLDLTAAANFPTLTFSSSPNGSLPAINCGSGATAFVASAATPTQAQPLTVSGVYIRTSTPGSAGGIFGDGGNVRLIGTPSGADLTEIDAAGTPVTSAATDNVWHAIASLANGASSALKVDSNSEATGNPGTAGLTGGNIRICRAAFAQAGNVLVAEAAMWAATSSGTDRSNLNSNAHSQYGW